MSILKYDVDCVTWSPQGKLLQVEYAMEAVNQGSICLGIKSKRFGVLMSVKKNPTKLACYQEKVFKISNQIGISISGMTADARVLCKYMRKQNTKHQITYSKNIPVEFLAEKVASKYRGKTYIYGKRPFGVGILMLGYDNLNTPRLYELTPNGDCIEYEAFAIGAKSQTSKTYLEKNLNKFSDAELDKIILHGLMAIKSGYRDEKEEMSENNIEISVLDKHGFRNLNENDVKIFLEKLNDFKPENEMEFE
jgi:20S proteasome subunit alpha 6